MQQAHFAFGPLDGLVTDLPADERRFRDERSDTTYAPAPFAVEWSVGMLPRRGPTRHYSVQPTPWVPMSTRPQKIKTWAHGYTALFIYLDLLLRLSLLCPKRLMYDVTLPALQREKRSLRSQLARPYDGEWEERYLSIAVYHSTTKGGNGILLVESPYDHDMSAVRAGLDKLTATRILMRPGRGNKTETVVHVTTEGETGVLE